MIERATLAEALSAEGVDVDQARATLAGADDSPLVVRALAGVGAWFAAAFLIGFMAAADMLDNEATWIIFGALLVVGGTALRTVAAERDEGDFLVQLSLAFCLAGQALRPAFAWQTRRLTAGNDIRETGDPACRPGTPRQRRSLAGMAAVHRKPPHRLPRRRDGAAGLSAGGGPGNPAPRRWPSRRRRNR